MITQFRGPILQSIALTLVVLGCSDGGSVDGSGRGGRSANRDAGRGGSPGTTAAGGQGSSAATGGVVGLDGGGAGATTIRTDGAIGAGGVQSSTGGVTGAAGVVATGGVSGVGGAKPRTGGSTTGTGGAGTGGGRPGTGGAKPGTGGSTTGTGGATTGTGGSTSGTGGATTGTGGASGQPMIAGCAIFPADNPWNTDISSFPLHPNSAGYIANMAPTAPLHADFGTDYGIPYNVVPGTQPKVPMEFDYESDPGPYPIPPNPLMEGPSDSHILVLDRDHCLLYETWASEYVGPGWQCGSGAIFNLASNALRPEGWTSADAAGLPILPGLVRFDEVKAGEIKHAIRFTVANTYQGYIHPATHAAGKPNPALPPMGLRARLKASFDTSGFSGATLVILKALKKYGVMLADNGSNWYITGETNDGWAAYNDEIVAGFRKVHGSDFEVVDTGPVVK